jgi:protein involved in polysaccharide export with SLBB domain
LGYTQTEVPVVPEDEINYVIEKGIENGLSDFQITDELRKRGLGENELSILNAKILNKRREKLKLKEEAVLSDGADSLPDNDKTDKSTLLSSKMEVKSNVFGREIFLQNQISFTPEIRTPSPENYSLGSGDKLMLDVSGVQDRQQELSVSAEGFVRINLIGPVFVAGLTLSEAKNKIKSLFAKIYPQITSGSTKISLYLSRFRSIQVLVTGEAVKPGHYNVSSLSTVLNVLYDCGGPSDLGSFRNIELIRGNKILDTIDLYPFLTKGILPKDYRLEERDVIRIPMSENVVNMNGAIKKPMMYEFSEGESLAELIQYAGGFKEGAYKSQIQIERFTDKEKLVMDITNEHFSACNLLPGDKVSVGFVLDRFSNKVTISGSVYRPGAYSLETTKSIKELIKVASGLKPDAYQQRALLFRLEANDRKSVIKLNLKAILEGESEDILLQSDDELVIKSIFELEEETSVTINGSVQNPGSFPFREGIKLEDLLFLAGGLKSDAYKERIIIYRKGLNQKKESFSLSITNTNKEDIYLSVGDIIYVQSQEKMNDIGYVTILGEVKKPGIIPFADSLSLQDVIVLSDGLTEFASVSNIEIVRRLDSINLFSTNSELTKSINVDLSTLLDGKTGDLSLRAYDVITVRRNPQIREQAFVKIEGEVLFPGEYALQRRDDRISSLFLRAGGGLPEANLDRAKLSRKLNTSKVLDEIEANTEKIVEDEKLMEDRVKLNLNRTEIDVAINLKQALKNPGSNADIFLENGDKLIIPKVNKLILIDGEVYQPIGINYIGGKGTKYYVNQAGGFKNGAEKDKTYIIYPDGRALATRKILGLFNSYPNIEPGAMVMVPKVVVENKTKKPLSISDLALASSTIAGISTFILGIVQLLK